MLGIKKPKKLESPGILKVSKLKEWIKFPEEYIRQANKLFENGEAYDNEVFQAYAALADIKHVCTQVPSLLQDFALNNESKSILEIPQNIQIEMNKRKKLYEKYFGFLHHAAKVAQTCKEMLIHCIWMGKTLDCAEIFQTVLTDAGFCCTFNMIPYLHLVKSKMSMSSSISKDISELWQDLNNENLLFSKETKNRSIPFRQKTVGRSAGLSFVVNPDLQEYTCTNTDSNGFMIALNQAIDLPSVKNQIPIAVPINSEVVVVVRPKVIMPDPSIASFEPKVRQCYLAEEFKLSALNTYTLQNCHWDCWANTTSAACGCGVNTAKVSESRPPCSTQDRECLKTATDKLYERGLREVCSNCLPSCTEIQYHAETSTLSLRQEKLEMMTRQVPYFNAAQNLSIVHVFFGRNSIFPMVRKQLYTKIDLISAAGGLLGLCMGCSVLSLLEVIYYFTIRVGCNRYKMKTTRDATKVKILFVTSRTNPQSYEKKKKKVKKSFPFEKTIHFLQGK